ncbi:hypothetical protein KKE60_06235 [Patescibacteria group bacterium]|nr:hypothetical protein [Patescibacteria group bacterium]
MTKEEILVMNPSMQLGDLVATEVMKWHREGDHWVSPEGFWIKAEGLNGWYPWRDISAAWLVVEKLKDYYPKIKFNQYSRKWEVEFLLCAIALADTAPEAICKAALLAKLEERHD